MTTTKNEEPKIEKKLYRYVCPACTGTAIETTNKMLGVQVQCISCGKLITLNQEANYIKL